MSRLTQRDRSITMLNIYKNPSSIIKGIIYLYISYLYVLFYILSFTIIIGLRDIVLYKKPIRSGHSYFT